MSARANVQRMLDELQADLARRARNNAMLRHLVREAGRELAECARRSQSKADGKGFHWHDGRQEIMPRQIWIMQDRGSVPGVIGLLITELMTTDGPDGGWEAGDILPVAKVSSCDATALALALQIASEPLGEFSPTAEKINLQWMDAGERGVCPCEERWMSCDDEEWSEYANCILWPVAGCGDAAMATGYHQYGGDFGFEVYVRPTIQEKQKSGRLAGKRTSKLGGKRSAEAGDQATALGCDDTDVAHAGQPGEAVLLGLDMGSTVATLPL